MALAFAAVFGCSFPDMHGYRPEIVVEGWIEDGGYPVVIVTTTVPVTDEFKEWGSLNDHVVRWAKVTVSDGEREEVLTGKMDKDYFPPYVYYCKNKRRSREEIYLDGRVQREDSDCRDYCSGSGTSGMAEGRTFG